MYPACQKSLPSPLEGQLSRARGGLSDTGVLLYMTLGPRENFCCCLSSFLFCLFVCFCIPLFNLGCHSQTVRKREDAFLLHLHWNPSSRQGLLQVCQIDALQFPYPGHPSPPAASPASKAPTCTTHGHPLLAPDSIKTTLPL